MRGKGKCNLATFFDTGITPAYAGKSLVPRWVAKKTKDHPRLCGEKSNRCQSRMWETGSPPPMRGKVFTDSCGGQFARITPAYAGKSGVLWIHDDLNLDHPRLCGEKGFYKKIPRVRIGSPPPMRGKVQSGEAVTQICGITPAYAGKSGRCSTGCFLHRDHPRLCGEKQNFSR